jgi:peptide chain release factor subunit 1
MDDATYEARRRLERLQSASGTGTELISVYVPAGKTLQSTRERLQSEHAQAANIKSKRTRTRVRKALS